MHLDGDASSQRSRKGWVRMIIDVMALPEVMKDWNGAISGVHERLFQLRDHAQWTASSEQRRL